MQAFLHVCVRAPGSVCVWVWLRNHAPAHKYILQCVIVMWVLSLCSWGIPHPIMHPPVAVLLLLLRSIPSMEKVSCIMLNTLHSCQKRSGRRMAADWWLADWLIGARCYITGWLLFKGVQESQYRSDCGRQHELIKLIRRSHDRGAWLFSFHLQESQPDLRTHGSSVSEKWWVKEKKMLQHSWTSCARWVVWVFGDVWWVKKFITRWYLRK